MSGITDLLNTAAGGAISGAAGAIGGGIGSQVTYGLGQLTGYNDSLANRQIEQQKRLTGIQTSANAQLMKQSYGEQYELWNKTQAEAQVKHLQNAGLNPALIYAKGGAGGSTSGGGGSSVGGANASDESSRAMANTQMAGMGLQMQKMASEIEVNKSIAEVNRATAGKNTADTKTTEGERDYRIEKTRQEGKSQWLQNIEREYKMNPEEGVNTYKNKNVDYGTAAMGENSQEYRKVQAEIGQAVANTGNAEAMKVLNNNKALGYFQELLNDTARADAAGVTAAAAKLNAEFGTGTEINWKNIGEMVLRFLRK